MYDLAVADTPILSEETSLVRRFLSWLPLASTPERADAANALARAYLHCDLAPEVRAQAEIAMTTVLDDAEPSVRRALAEALASAREAPRHILLALANDHSDVSRVVLRLSPLLSETELVDAVAIGDAAAQTAVARRAHLTASISAALAEVGDRAAVLALIANTEAEISRASLWRLFERFRRDDHTRARLGERPGTPASFRAAIAAATTDALAGFAANTAWLDSRRTERMSREGREQAFIAIAAEGGDSDLNDLVQWLRTGDHLTVGLLLRALASGGTRLLRQSLTEMSGLPLRRVEGLLRDPKGRGFAALYRKAGMPAQFLPAFRVAVDLAKAGEEANVTVDFNLTIKMLRAIEAQQNPELAPIVAMLWRLASEGARDVARGEIVGASTSPEIEQIQTAALEFEASAPPVLMLQFEPGNENDAPPISIVTADPLPVAA